MAVRCSARYVIEDREDSALVVHCELDAGHAGDHEADTPYDRAWWAERILSMGEYEAPQVTDHGKLWEPPGEWLRRIFESVQRGGRLTVMPQGVAPSMADRVQRNVLVLVWAAATGEDVTVSYASEEERAATMARLEHFVAMLDGATDGG